MWYFVLVESSQGDCVGVSACRIDRDCHSRSNGRHRIDQVAKVGRITTKRKYEKENIFIVGLILTIRFPSTATDTFASSQAS